MASELSKRLRSRGNQVYSEGCSDDLAPVVRSGRLLKASKLYRQAFDASRSDEERAKSCKNLGAAHWKHAQLNLEVCDEGRAPPLEGRPPSFDIERSVEFYLFALRYGRASHQHPEWRKSIEDRLEEIATNIVGESAWLLSKPEFVGNISKLFQAQLSPASKSQAWATFQLGHARNLFESAARVLGDKAADRSASYSQCLSLLHRCYHPIEEAQRRAPFDFLENIRTVKSSVDSCRLTCESIQAREAGKRTLLEASKLKDAGSRRDLEICALDKFKEAAVIARGVDAECEAEALASVGDLYKDHFKKEKQAHPYYEGAVCLAQQSDTMQSANWYHRAKVALENFFKQKDRASPNSMLPEIIRQDVEKLEVEYKKTTETFLQYVYTAHPPRGSNGSCALGEVGNGANTRLALRKAIQHYHPDHNAVVDDARWIALCGEITKLLLQKHRAY